ncbi:MAG: hypothetical protein EOO22_00770 [Comamonadaceae bacterium]|nr:MAG: hypothetical protein EOO22_00770 [Comamonadaceae bacterium]
MLASEQHVQARCCAPSLSQQPNTRLALPSMSSGSAEGDKNEADTGLQASAELGVPLASQGWRFVCSGSLSPQRQASLRGLPERLEFATKKNTRAFRASLARSGRKRCPETSLSSSSNPKGLQHDR